MPPCLHCRRLRLSKIVSAQGRPGAFTSTYGRSICSGDCSRSSTSQGCHIPDHSVIRRPDNLTRSIILPASRTLAPSPIDSRVSSESRGFQYDRADPSNQVQGDEPLPLQATLRSVTASGSTAKIESLFHCVVASDSWHFLSHGTALDTPGVPHQSQSRRPATHIAGPQSRNCRSGIVFAQS